MHATIKPMYALAHSTAVCPSSGKPSTWTTSDVYGPDGDRRFEASFPRAGFDGRSWRIVVQPQGMVAWSENPEEGFPKLYFLQVETPERAERCARRE